MTGTGMIVFFLSVLFSWLGLNADAGQIQMWADALIKVAGLGMLILGQLMRQDLSWGLFRKRPF